MTNNEKESSYRELASEIDQQIEDLRKRLLSAVSIAEEEEIEHKITVLINRKNNYYNEAFDL